MAWASGMLDERVTFRRKTLAKDNYGGSVTTWADYATAWAHVRPLTGREREAAMRPEGVEAYLVVVRNRSDLQDDDVIRWRSRDMNIRFIRNRGPRTAWLEIEADMGAPL
jgi:SPP1 family predicted phage head-tail adaptor